MKCEHGNEIRIRAYKNDIYCEEGCNIVIEGCKKCIPDSEKIDGR